MSKLPCTNCVLHSACGSAALRLQRPQSPCDHPAHCRCLCCPRSTRLLDNEIRVLRDESNRLTHEKSGLAERVKENHEKIKLNNQLPYLVANIVEVLELDAEEEEEEDGAITYQESGKKGKCVVLKTSTRQTVFLPVAGLVDPDTLKPGDLVGVNKDSYLILDTLPAEYDSRVKAMEVDEKPVEDYSDIGGLDKQIQELREAIVLPITHKDRFKALGIKPPKGVLLYGPPGAFMLPAEGAEGWLRAGAEHVCLLAVNGFKCCFATWLVATWVHLAFRET